MNSMTSIACEAQSLISPTYIEIFTDGSCIGNPGYGGYGFVLLRKDAHGKIISRVEGCGFPLEITTNVRMELTAPCAALSALGRDTGEPITFFCDANLISNAMNGWLRTWKAKNWKKSDGKPVVNRDLWEELERAVDGRNVTWKWVRGHNGNEHNERADDLAQEAACEAKEVLTGR